MLLRYQSWNISCYHWYVKTKNKYIKNYDKNNELIYILIVLYGYAMLQKLPVGAFKWIEDTSQFNEDFIKDYDENSDIAYFLEVDVQYPEKLHELYIDLPFIRFTIFPRKDENQKE